LEIESLISQMMSKHDKIFSRGGAESAENIGFTPALFFSAPPRETLFGSGLSGLGKRGLIRHPRESGDPAP
jgi:hypothetical protein